MSAKTIAERAPASSATEPPEPPARDGERVDALLGQVAGAGEDQASGGQQAERALEALGAVRTVSALPISLGEGGLRVDVRGVGELSVALAPGVQHDVIALAIEQRQSVLLEHVEGQAPLCIGVLLTRWPERLELRSHEVVIEARDELRLISGQAGMRLRKDGDVELLGSRVSHVSRGLFRLVGRVLRLN